MHWFAAFSSGWVANCRSSKKLVSHVQVSCGRARPAAVTATPPAAAAAAVCRLARCCCVQVGVGGWWFGGSASDDVHGVCVMTGREAAFGSLTLERPQHPCRFPLLEVVFAVGLRDSLRHCTVAGWPGDKIFSPKISTQRYNGVWGRIFGVQNTQFRVWYFNFYRGPNKLFGSWSSGHMSTMTQHP